MANVLDLALFSRDGVRAACACDGVARSNRDKVGARADGDLVAGSQKKRVALEAGTMRGKEAL